jgi:hypothetical protein
MKVTLRTVEWDDTFQTDFKNKPIASLEVDGIQLVTWLYCCNQELQEPTTAEPMN